MSFVSSLLKSKYTPPIIILSTPQLWQNCRERHFKTYYRLQNATHFSNAPRSNIVYHDVPVPSVVRLLQYIFVASFFQDEKENWESGATVISIIFEPIKIRVELIRVEKTAPDRTTILDFLVSSRNFLPLSQSWFQIFIISKYMWIAFFFKKVPTRSINFPWQFRVERNGSLLCWSALLQGEYLTNCCGYDSHRKDINAQEKNCCRNAAR